MASSAREEAFLHFQPEYTSEKDMLEKVLREQFKIFPVDGNKVPGEDAVSRLTAQIMQARYCFIDVSNTGRLNAEAEGNIVLGIADGITRLQGGARKVMLLHEHATAVPSLYQGYQDDTVPWSGAGFMDCISNPLRNFVSRVRSR